MNELGLRILAETPPFIARKVASTRKTRPDADARSVAEAVVNALNEGQRWELAVSAVEVDVIAFDRALVRTIERASVVRTRSQRPPRVIDPTLVQAAIADASAVRELAERAARDMTIALTADLLNSSVRLGDGTEVLIGDATPEQRTTRINMLEGHAQGGLDTLTFEIALLNLQGRGTLRQAKA